MKKENGINRRQALYYILNVFKGNKLEIIHNLMFFNGIGLHKASICLEIYDAYVTGNFHFDCNKLGCNILQEDIADELNNLVSLE